MSEPHLESDALRPRLFGYGLLYRARLSSSGELEPAPAEGSSEAAALARALQGLTSRSSSREPEVPVAGREVSAAYEWAVSVPFGRCGLEGRPLEYLVVCASEGHLEELGPDGFASQAVAEGEILTVVPGRVVRLRLRPGVGERALVAFQTEDRTPLHGHAAPISCGGRPAPLDHPARVQSAWQAFNALRAMATDDPARYRQELEGFFTRMSRALTGDGQIDQLRQQAQQAGSYSVADQRPLFERQAELLTEDVLGRVASADPSVFRFPGMFGAVCPLFDALK